jgi:hypothetical protein
MTRHKLPPDNRPDWRDPDIPVLIEGRWYTPDEMQRVCQDHVKEVTELMDRHPQLYWRNDPLYNGKKK